MSSTPASLEIQFLDHIPIEKRPKPLYGNITAVSLSTGECQITTYPSSVKQKKRQPVKVYTFIITDLPPTQASRVLYRAIEKWLSDKADAQADLDDIKNGIYNIPNTTAGNAGQGGGSLGHKSQPSHSSSGSGGGLYSNTNGHSRSVDMSHNKSASSSSSFNNREKEKEKLRAAQERKLKDLERGPRVTFFDEADVVAPPPLPPKDSRSRNINTTMMMTSQLVPSTSNTSTTSPSKRRHHHHQHRRKASGSRSQRQSGSLGQGQDVCHAIDIGLVWWISDLHGVQV